MTNTNESIWQQVSKLDIIRSSQNYENTKIDPGVIFFVLALERLGAKPRYSCEGHPYGFYTNFTADYDLVKQIAAAGFFNVLVEGSEDEDLFWSIRLLQRENDFDFSEQSKNKVLQWASEAWLKKFPELKSFFERTLNNPQPQSGKKPKI